MPKARETSSDRLTKSLLAIIAAGVTAIGGSVVRTASSTDFESDILRGLQRIDDQLQKTNERLEESNRRLEVLMSKMEDHDRHTTELRRN